MTSASGDTLSSVTFAFGWLSAAGTLLVIAGLLTMLVLRVPPAWPVQAYVETLVQLRTAILTVMAVLALAYVMNQSGQTDDAGLLPGRSREALRRCSRRSSAGSASR